MAKSVDAEWVEKKLRSANDTMESVQTLSLWALKHKNQCEQIVDIWLKVLKSEVPSQMIVMFYLCNEVLQTCKKKNAHVYKDSFKNVLKEAISVVKDETAVVGLEKILHVWSDRKVFEESFIAELNNLLIGGSTLGSSEADLENANATKKEINSNPGSPLSKRAKLGIQVSDFNLATLCSLVKSEAKQKLKFKDEKFRCSRLIEDIDDVTGMGTEIQKVYMERHEDDINNLCSHYVDLDNYLDVKHKLCEHLDIAIQFYDGLLKDAKLVSSAYKNYGNRVKNLSKKLADRRHLLMLSEQSKQVEEEEEEEDEDEESNNPVSRDKLEECRIRTDKTFNSRKLHPASHHVNQRQKSKNEEEFNVYKDIHSSQEKVEDEEDKLFTHLFLEDPSEDDHLHQQLNEAATGGAGIRRQSLDARLELMGFPGLKTTVEVKTQMTSCPSHDDRVTRTYDKDTEHSKVEFYEKFKKAPLVTTALQFIPDRRAEFSSPVAPVTFITSNFQNQQPLPSAPQQLHQQVLFHQNIYLPQISQQQILHTNEMHDDDDDDGRETPVQDEPPSPEPSNSIQSKSSKFNDTDRTKGRDETDELFRDFCKKSDSLKRLRRERDKDSSSRSSHRNIVEDRKHREKSGRRKDRHDDERRKSGISRDRRSDKEHSKSSRSRHRSRDSSRESEKRARRFSPDYLAPSKRHDSNRSRSNTKDLSPLLKRHSRSPSTSPSSKTLKPPVADYLRKLPGNGSEIVMEGIYQAVERPDGYSEIYRLPSNMDPSQYTYEEVVYLFTEEDGTPQLKQLVHNVPTSSMAGFLHTTGAGYMASNASVVSSGSGLPTFPVMSGFEPSASPAISHVHNAGPGRPQALVPINMVPGISRPPLLSPPMSLQMLPPALPQQTVYPFIQRPPPPLPTVLPQVVSPVMAPPPLLNNQLKDSAAQPSSLLGIPLVNQIPSSSSNFAPSFSGLSRVLPSPSQFCQGIGATALLQRRLDENSLESMSRLRSSQTSGGKSQVSSTRRESILTTIPLMDDVSPGNESACSTGNSNQNLVSISHKNMSSASSSTTRHVTGKCQDEGILEEGHMQKSLSVERTNSEPAELSNTLFPSQEVLEAVSGSVDASKVEDISTGLDSQMVYSAQVVNDDGFSDNGSSDLEDLQDAVTFTSPLSISATSDSCYSRGRDASNQSGFLKKSENSRTPNRGRGLLGSAFIAPRLPMFPAGQQLRSSLSTGINFGQMSLGFAALPPFGVGIPLNMPTNRLNAKGNPRF